MSRQNADASLIELPDGEVIDLTVSEFEICTWCEGRGWSFYDLDPKCSPWKETCQNCSGNGGWWTS